MGFFGFGHSLSNGSRRATGNGHAAFGFGSAATVYYSSPENETDISCLVASTQVFAAAYELRTFCKWIYAMESCKTAAHDFF